MKTFQFYRNVTKIKTRICDKPTEGVVTAIMKTLNGHKLTLTTAEVSANTSSNQ